ncbi:hypothetical protein [Acinetobacter modestus]|uniref:hypothetical protein n=1 Tax=Acinetobacter modestus TaxID=1776740 RepID=UPI0030197133
MRSFNDWYFDLFESGNGSCLNQQEIAEEAWDYRQTEVDKLIQHIKRLESKLDSLGADRQGLVGQVYELQKRVDAAIYLLPSIKAENDLWGCDQVDRQIELLEQALKGEHA